MTAWDWFNAGAGVASIVGLAVSLITLWIAARVRTVVHAVRKRLIRRIRIQEIRATLASGNRSLNNALSRNQVESAMTVLHRLDADLAQLAGHASAELSKSVSTARSVVARLTTVGHTERKSVLCDLRDAIERIVRQAENLERELAWSESHE